MRRHLGIVALLLATACTALAQDEAPPRGEGRVGERLRERRGGMSTFFERIAEDVGITDDQRAAYDELVKQYTDKMRENRPSNEESAELSSELAEARRAGDRKRSAEIAAKLRGDDGKMMDHFFDDLQPILSDEQAAKLPKIRERSANRRAAAGGDAEARLRILRDDLKLDESQQAKFDDLAKKLTKSLDEAGKDREDEDALLETVRKAAESGDEGEVRRIRTDFEERRGRPDRAYDEFVDELEPILKPEQQRTLDRFRRDMQPGRSRDNDPRNLFRVARRLDLDQAARDGLRDLERDYGEAMREARGDREAIAKMGEEAKAEIKKLLTDEQSKQFDEMLARGGDRRGRGDEAGRGERGRDRERQRDGEGSRRRPRDPGTPPPDENP